MKHSHSSAETVQHTCRVLDGGIDGPYNEPDPACCSGRALEARDTLLRVLKRYGGEPYSHVAIDAAWNVAWNAAVALLNEPQTSGVWQPIETAPIGAKSHDQILVGFMGQFHWLSFVAFPNGSNTSAPGYAKPTHWMPIPALSLTRPQRESAK